MNIVAVDVSKARLDVFDENNKCFSHYENNKLGIEELLKHVKNNDPIFVFEATGGYEMGLAIALIEAKKLFVRCSGAKVRCFAKSQGKAKTDKIDAMMIAKYARVSELKPFKIADKNSLRLRELNTRRSQTLDLLSQEANRLEHKHSKDIERLIKKNTQFFKKQLEFIEEKINALIEEDSYLQEKMEIIKSIPGIGDITAITLISELPELGYLNKSEVASLTGLAPFNKDSGTYQGKRKITRSRPRIKRVLYMAAMSAIRNNSEIKEFYNKLKQKGKPGKLALIACMRKLVIYVNAMVASNSKWKFA